ncbi:MAG: hypothetical protein ACOCP8_10070 [archaeon]
MVEEHKNENRNFEDDMSLEEENLDGLIKIKKVMEDNNIKKNKHIELVI